MQPTTTILNLDVLQRNVFWRILYNHEKVIQVDNDMWNRLIICKLYILTWHDVSNKILKCSFLSNYQAHIPFFSLLFQTVRLVNCQAPISYQRWLVNFFFNLVWQIISTPQPLVNIKLKLVWNQLAIWM